MSYPHIMSIFFHINLPWYPHGETARLLWLCLGTHDAIPRHEPALEPGRHVQPLQRFRVGPQGCKKNNMYIYIYKYM